MYGGASTDSGGFLEPHVHVLTRGDGSDEPFTEGYERTELTRGEGSDEPFTEGSERTENASLSSEMHVVTSPLQSQQQQQQQQRRAGSLLSVGSRRSSVASLPPLEEEGDQVGVG